MIHLRLLIQKMKPKETEALVAVLMRSRGRSKKRYELFCLLKDECSLHEHTIITKLYGDSENSKQNYRKLVLRLEKDILSIVEKKNAHFDAIKQMERGILSVQRLNVLLSNDYGDGLIQSEFENMDRQAKNNQLFLNQVLLERAKCESFYLSVCPLVSMEKMKSIHEVAKFVTEAKLFHMSCKRYYLLEGENLELLDKTQRVIHEYYIKCNEPVIGFHYHAGSIIMNFIKNESETCCYHIDQLDYLARKHDVLNKGGFNDEFVLLKFLCATLKLNGSTEVKQLLTQNFYRSFNSAKNSLLKRVQTKPFELDVLIRLLIIREDSKTAIFLINTVVKSGLFKKSEHLMQRLDQYGLIANSILGKYSNVNLILKKIQATRKSCEAMRFYLPMYKFLIHNELSVTNFLDNLDSFRRNLRRNVTLFHDSGLSVKEVDLLRTIYRVLSNQLSDKRETKSFVDTLLNYLKSNFNPMDIHQIHVLVLIKWLETSSPPKFKNHYLLSPKKIMGKTQSF